MRTLSIGISFLVAFTFLACCLLNTGVHAQDKESEKRSEAAPDDSVPMSKLEKAKPSDEKTDADADDVSDDAEEEDAEEEGTKDEKESNLLTIGSDAPSLDIETWIHDGEGKFEHVTDFEPGKVYVVEFWATWCGPCIAAMPHIVEMQKKYADQGVQVVSISSEPIETINKFLKREVPGMRVPDGDEEEADDEDADDADDDDADDEEDEEDEEDEDETRAVTFEELTSSYCLTSDPDRSSSDDYMRAAGQNGIPCAFIVGKDAKVEWIGHPMTMDEVLEAVVNDSWDREVFAKEFVEEQLAGKIYYEVVTLMRAEETKKALEKIDSYLETGTHDASISRMQRLKIQLLLGDESMREEAKTYVLELLDANQSDAMLANSVGWSVYRLTLTSKFEDGAFLQDIVDRVSQSADSIDNTEQKSFKPYLLDTIAHLHHALGNLELAIETQKQAIELVEDERGKERLQRFLDELTAEPEKDADSNVDAEVETKKETVE